MKPTSESPHHKVHIPNFYVHHFHRSTTHFLNREKFDFPFVRFRDTFCFFVFLLSNFQLDGNLKRVCNLRGAGNLKRVGNSKRAGNIKRAGNLKRAGKFKEGRPQRRVPRPVQFTERVLGVQDSIWIDLRQY